MRVLVTRHDVDARETAARLAALGHEALVAPLIAINFLDGPEVDLAGVQAFLATSSNGVRALARRSPERHLPLFAVGRQTARTARELGFVAVKDFDGDAMALADFVSTAVPAGSGLLLHATAREASGALAEALTKRGFRVRRENIYETPAVEILPAIVGDALRARRLDAVLLFSARSAEVFRERVREAGLSLSCRSLKAFCISKACADALAPLGFSHVSIAAAPNQDALLALLGP